MSTITISVPNDWGSEDRMKAAIAECYDGDLDAAGSDGGRALFDRLADAATGAGLVFQAETDFGAEWSGSAEQCANARETLPVWACVGEIED